MNFADALDQQLRRGLLQNDSGSPELHRLHEFVLVVRSGQYNHPSSVAGGLQPLQGSKAVQTRHFQIEKQNVGLMFLQHLQDFPAIVRLSHDHKIFFQGQQAAKPVAENRMVVRHYDPDFLFGVRYGGRR